MSSPKCEYAVRWRILGGTVDMPEVTMVVGEELLSGCKPLAPLTYFSTGAGITVGWQKNLEGGKPTPYFRSPPKSRTMSFPRCIPRAWHVMGTPQIFVHWSSNSLTSLGPSAGIFGRWDRCSPTTDASRVRKQEKEGEQGQYNSPIKVL